ncbi:hypothetical protein KI688_010645 [Linnemannia hyalina]|uniref:F-box domain-containing protein n=1 Tax=Linnemannia hyalina TaxID=64524 RepID=A0A9P7XXH8_9FUNG|nr:hypothetical protein KI688_010645 [Linnemannia hyalina]
MTGLIDLPEELLAIIASSLSKGNLAQLVSSCRQLSHSSSLLAYLWQEISLESDFPYLRCDNFGDRACRPLKGGVLVSAGRLSQYAGFVQSLSLLGPFRTEYYQISFPQLHKLSLFHEIDYSSPDGKEDDAMEAEQQVNNAELVRRNPNIKELSIHVEFARPPSDFWEAIYSTLQDPICLHLSDVKELQGADVVDSFWRACTLFEEIESNGSDMDVSKLLPTLTFPRLKRLVFRSTDWNKKRFYPLLQFDWFKQCPNLTKLHWELFYGSIPVEAWAQAMERKTWPDLEDLSLRELAEDDEDLAVMFAHLPPLPRFTLESRKFGQQAFLALQNRLFASIRVLDMSGTYKFTSQMAVNVLEQCVHLEDFRAVMINVEDLCGPWLCEGLKSLHVFFMTETEVSNDIAFHRLSVMSQLEECYFSRTFSVENRRDLPVPEGAYTLQWKLGLGLERLVQLKKLRTIAFKDAAQKDMGVDELVWLKENLPALKEVGGTFSRVKEKCEELERFAATLGLEL